MKIYDTPNPSIKLIVPFIDTPRLIPNIPKLPDGKYTLNIHGYETNYEYLNGIPHFREGKKLIPTIICSIREYKLFETKFTLVKESSYGTLYKTGTGLNTEYVIL